MAAGLLADAVARVDQDDREVGGGRAGDHVARVLLVARRVGDDELAATLEAGLTVDHGTAVVLWRRRRLRRRSGSSGRRRRS